MNPRITEAMLIFFMKIVLGSQKDAKSIRVGNTKKELVFTTILFVEGYIDICVDSKENCFVYDVTSRGVEMLEQFKKRMNASSDPFDNSHL